MQTLIAVFVFGVTLAAQDGAQSPFALDPKKPYVYLEFDHAGQRKPLGPNDSNQGLWLKFVNNCRLPVTVRAFYGETAGPGISLEDEVVPVSGPWGVGPAETISVPSSTSLVPPGQDTERQRARPPNRTDTATQGKVPRVGPALGQESGRPEAPSEPGEMPIGYSSECSAVETVSPGESVLFSVPREHVGPRWFLRVRFNLVVSPLVRGDEEPYSYVDFPWSKLPDEVRRQKR